MRILADENIAPDTVAFLRRLGHDVVETSRLPIRGCPDRDVVQYAEADARVILTCDLGFGRTYYFDRTRRYGTIVVRAEPQIPSVVHPMLGRFHRDVLPRLEAPETALVVLSPGRCRVRRRDD